MIKKIGKILGALILLLLIAITTLVGYIYLTKSSDIQNALEKAGPSADTLLVDGNPYRDLNKNGKLDAYEDKRIATQQRVENLLAQMTLAEKAGLLFHDAATVGSDGQFAGPLNMMNLLPIEIALLDKKMSFFNLFEVPDVTRLAEWHNRVQALAERTRLGIPVTISSDPRHSVYPENATIGFGLDGFSKWTEPIGFAAIRDSALVHRFGQIAAAEYRAVGIHTALHPMIDVATDPRWARINGTFGEDAESAAKLGAAYITGFQGDSLQFSSVSTMTKHFPGGGPQDDGWDAHFRFGKDQVYPGGRFDYHLSPFKEAIDAETSQMMPYYGVPVGQTSEDVAFAFNQEIISGLLQDSLGYDGIVCTDWGLITTKKLLGLKLERFIPFAGTKNFGVEDLTPKQRILKALDAGVDQFGGESVPELLIELIEEGALPEQRIDRSVRKLLALKFKLGLFDQPYVDVSLAAKRTGTKEAMEIGYESQIRSQVLLTNKQVAGKPLLPLSSQTKIYIKDIQAEVAGRFGMGVHTIEEADVAILKIPPPRNPEMGNLFGEPMFPMGRLYYTEEELAPIMEIIRKKPTVIVTFLSRPAILPELADSASAILANFGASDAAIFDILFGNQAPTGKLPFEMPSSWDAVLEQKEDTPFDSENPLFPYGHGLTYE